MKPSPQSCAISRRRFLSQSATAAAVAACSAGGRAWAEPPASPWNMRLATSSIHYTRLPIEQACQRIAELGFEAIDIWSPHAGCPHLDDAKDRLGADGLKQVLEQNKLKPYAYSVYSGGFPKYADFIGAMGGGLAVRGSTGRRPPDEVTARMKEFVESLQPELELAEKHNVSLAIENHSGQLLNSLDSLKAFVEFARHPRLGIAWRRTTCNGSKPRWKKRSPSAATGCCSSTLGKPSPAPSNCRASARPTSPRGWRPGQGRLPRVRESVYARRARTGRDDRRPAQVAGLPAGTREARRRGLMPNGCRAVFRSV
jgi:hypothetical protein